MIAILFCAGIAPACSAPDKAEEGSGFGGLAGYGALPSAPARPTGPYARTALALAHFWRGTTASQVPFDNVKDILLLPHRDLIIIANAGDGSLQFFNMEGQWQYSAGGTGDGPGEFRALQGLWSYVGDSLLTFDPFQQRAVVWDISGAASRTVTVANPPAGPRFVSLRGPLPDGRLVWSSPVIIDRPAGRHRIPEKILVTSASGTVQNVFGPFPGFEQSERTAPFDLGEVPFSSELLVAVREGDILISNTAQFVVTVYDAEGQRKSALGTIIESVPVTEEWIRLDAMRKELWYKRGPRSPLRVNRLAGIPNLEYPDSFPVSSAMEIGPRGRAWIAAYALPHDSTPSPSHVWPATVSNVWYVFDSSGAALGTVTFPDRFLVLDVGREFVAGVWRDEFDVEHVRIYRFGQMTPSAQALEGATTGAMTLDELKRMVAR